MSYRLRITPDLRRVWETLPQQAAEELTVALARVCDDPLGETVPYDGDEDGVMRELVLPSVVAVLLVLDGTKSVHLMQLAHLG